MEASFLPAYVLKSFPSGALYRTFPDGWCVWREDADAEGGYVLAYNSPNRPSGDQIDELLSPEDEGDGDGDPFAGLQKFITGFKAL